MLSEKEFEKMYKDNASGLVYFATKFLGDDKFAAEDIVADSFASLWANKDNKWNEHDHPLKYLKVTVKHKLLSFCKQNKIRDGHKKIIKELSSEEVQALDFKSDIVQLVMKKLKDMPEERRKVFLLSLHYDSTEIASMLGISSGTVGTQIMRAKKWLKEVFIEGKIFRKDFCIHGHEFTPENTFYAQNSRRCRMCHRARENKSYQDKKLNLITT